MRCGFCGHVFAAAEADAACGGCPLVGNCGLVRCPRCGYEMPPEARLIVWWREMRERRSRKGAPAREESRA